MTFTKWIEVNYSCSPTQLVYSQGNKYVRNLEEAYIAFCKENDHKPEIE